MSNWREQLTNKLKSCKTTAERTKVIGNFFHESISKEPGINPNELWAELGAAFVSHRSKLDLDDNQISDVISAEQGWRRSSGVALEQAVKAAFNPSLNLMGISIKSETETQKELKEKKVCGSASDLNAIRHILKERDFDTFMFKKARDQQYCFGAVQVKSSIRDRLNMNTRPSQEFMNKQFWSSVVCLDPGSYLELPKFNAMAKKYWHGFYVISKSEKQDGSIYYSKLSNHKNPFITHAIKAWEVWSSNRNKLDASWRP